MPSQEQTAAAAQSAHPEVWAIRQQFRAQGMSPGEADLAAERATGVPREQFNPHVDGGFLGDFGGFLGKAAPIGAALIPGIGPLAAAGIGGLGGLIGDGLGGALKGAAIGGAGNFAVGKLGGAGNIASKIPGLGGVAAKAGGLNFGSLGDLLGPAVGGGSILAGSKAIGNARDLQKRSVDSAVARDAELRPLRQRAIGNLTRDAGPRPDLSSTFADPTNPFAAARSGPAPTGGLAGSGVGNTLNDLLNRRRSA